jgi:hypothetical protein
MKAIYDASDNSLQEQSRMRKPLSPNPYTDCIDVISLQRYKDVVAEYERRMDEYNAHIASLRKIPCSPEAVNSFRHGIEYEENLHYRVIPLSVDFEAPAGTKIKAYFIDGHLFGGYDHHKEFAEKYLKPDTIYEIEKTDIGGWHTDFYLKEFPGKGFNSCHFIYPELFAVPLDPPKGEDIEDMRFTFDEVLEFVADFGRHVLKGRNAKWDMSNDSAEWLYDQLKQRKILGRPVIDNNQKQQI